jgi:hypothetical protein
MTIPEGKEEPYLMLDPIPTARKQEWSNLWVSVV